MRRILRASGNIRRRFAAAPHWVRDLYSLVSYVNFLELVPTLACLGFAPRHFFRRLPQTLSGKRTLFHTPVKFFANFAALFLMLFFLRHGELKSITDPQQASWFMLLLIPLTPVLMYVLGLGTYLLYGIVRFAPNGDSFPTPNHGDFRLLLSPVTYFRIDPSRYLWGLFYISLYFIAAWQVTQVVLALSVLAIAYIWSSLGDGHLAVRGILILFGIGLAAITVHGFVLQPYLALLRASLRYPTRAVLESDVHQLRERVQEFLALPNNSVEFPEQARQYAVMFADEIRRHDSLASQQESDVEFNADIRRSRCEILLAALQLDRIQDHIQTLDEVTKNKVMRSVDPQHPKRSINRKQAA